MTKFFIGQKVRLTGSGWYGTECADWTSAYQGNTVVIAGFTPRTTDGDLGFYFLDGFDGFDGCPWYVFEPDEYDAYWFDCWGAEPVVRGESN